MRGEDGVLVTGGCGYISSATVELLHDAQGGGGDRQPESRPPRRHADGGPLLSGRRRRPNRNRAPSRRARTGGVCPLRRADLCGRVGAGAGAVLPEQGRPDIALFEGPVEAGVRRLVVSPTCATYGEPERTPLDEGHPQRPQNPYGWGSISSSASWRASNRPMVSALWRCDISTGSHRALRRGPRPGDPSDSPLPGSRPRQAVPRRRLPDRGRHAGAGLHSRGRSG